MEIEFKLSSLLHVTSQKYKLETNFRIDMNSILPLNETRWHKFILRLPLDSTFCPEVESR